MFTYTYIIYIDKRFAISRRPLRSTAQFKNAVITTTLFYLAGFIVAFGISSRKALHFRRGRNTLHSLPIPESNTTIHIHISLVEWGLRTLK